MKPIKFRGRAQTIEPGKIVYGDIIHVNGEPTICDQFLYQYYVDADSIAQFVGYDKAGNEVYEGDIFVVPCGTEIAARLFDNITPKAKLKEVAK